MNTIPDDIDLTQYLRAAEDLRVLVRPASSYADKLRAEFAPRDQERRASMFSTKLRDRIQFRPGEVTVWAGYNGHRKALALDTSIPTASGWSTMGEIAVGDDVFDEKGEPCRVIAKSPVYRGEDCYRLRFSDGTTVIAHGGHEWLTETARARQSARTARRYDRLGRVGAPTQHDKREFAKVRTTREINDTLRVAAGGFAGLINHSVRLARPLRLPDIALPIAPYVLGAWLGDGTSIDGAITVGDHEVTEELVANGYPVVKRKAPLLYGIPGLRVQLRALGVLGDKRIPATYLRASQEQRADLLRGLMDTDGCAHLDGTLSFCSTKEPLAAGVAELVSSLGWQCVTRRGVAKLNGREIGPKWEVVFSADRPVFGIERKQARSKDTLSERARARFIVACDPVESVPVQCIEVDSRSHLYLATRAMIPTHNSMLTGQIALDMLVQRESVLMASFEMAPERTLARMGRQAWGMEFLSPNHQATFLAWAERLSIFDHKGTISPERCTAVCRYFAEELKGRHAFIDSMMMVCSSEEHLDEQKRFMTGMVRLAIETGLHIHLVAHCRKPTNEGTPPTKYDLRGSAAISDQADNVVMVWSDQAKKHAETKDRQKPDALVSVEKQRNGRWEGKAQLWFHDPSLRFTDGDEDFVDPYAGLQ